MGWDKGWGRKAVGWDRGELGGGGGGDKGEARGGGGWERWSLCQQPAHVKREGPPCN